MRLAAQVALLAALAALGAAVSAVVHPAREPAAVAAEDPHAITAEALAEALRSPLPPLVLDARSPAELTPDSIPGAIPWSDHGSEEALVRVIEAWDGTRAIVVFCGDPSCGLSKQLATALRRDLGTEKVLFLAGGWEAWAHRETKP